MTESAGMEAFRSIMRWLRSPEAQSQILLILMEFAVHQNVDVAQQLTRDVPVAQFSGQNIFFIVIAGVAPYRLFPDTPRVPAASVPTGRADFPVQGFAAQQGETANVPWLQMVENLILRLSGEGVPYWKSHASALKQPLQWWVQPDTNRLTRTPGPLATS